MIFHFLESSVMPFSKSYSVFLLDFGSFLFEYIHRYLKFLTAILKDV